MKRSKILYLIILFSLVTGCSDYIDVVPDNIATIDYAFRNRTTAEKYLFTCYSYLPSIGHPGKDPTIMGGDELLIHDKDPFYEKRLDGNFNAYEIQKGLQNVSNPHLNYWDGRSNGINLFIGIRDCNIFLDNIDLVHDLDDGERRRWIAEVKFLKAYYHFYLFRMYGPIPIVDKNLPISASTDEIMVFREPVDKVVDYINGLIDEAVTDLPVEIQTVLTEQGRITKPIALAVKAQLAVTAASPLFNGNSDYASMIDSRGVQLFNQTYDKNKWKIAMEACENAIDAALISNHRLYEFNDSRYPVSEETRQVMSIRNAFGERWNEEIIWGMTQDTRVLQYLSLPYFSMDDVQIAKSGPILAPTIQMAELFYSENGVPIDEDPTYDFEHRYSTSWAKNQKYYITDDFKTANLNQHREPRFYGNLGFDGGVWFGNGRYKDVGKGDHNTTAWTIHAKSVQPSGKTSSLNYSITGYYVKKYSNFETVTTTKLVYNKMSFPIIRLADLYLLYAEARNEYSGPDTEVYQYLDKIRDRAGLEGVVESWKKHSIYPTKPSNKEGLREIIRQERMIELAFEGKRFWDIRRWKIADKLLNRAMKGWNVKGETTEEYYNIITLDLIDFSTKEYLWPIRQYSLRVNENLLQNPYW